MRTKKNKDVKKKPNSLGDGDRRKEQSGFNRPKRANREEDLSTYKRNYGKGGKSYGRTEGGKKKRKNVGGKGW